MSGLELFTKKAARKLFLKNKTNSLTAADIRRGSWSNQLDCVINEVANSQSNLQIMELQDESRESVNLESFKESGNIEYTADVVWALQLYVLNSINPGNIADSRKKIDEAKKKQPRQIQLKCLKNRQGTNYDCCATCSVVKSYCA